MSIFTDTSLALAPAGVLPIENFHASIESADKLYIYYAIGETEVEKTLDIDVDSTKGYAATHDEPACADEAEITKVYGLSIQEDRALNEWLKSNDLEPDLLAALSKDDAADDGGAMNYAWGEVCSQPEPINNYGDRRGE